MERITYRKTLDVHKNGTQFLLQGFQTADNMSRVIEISLMASGDSIDFPLERLVAVMYVTSPGAKEPSINKCTIEDNKVVYEVLPITTEGITKMQLKLIEASPKGAKSVLASPEFAVEVTKGVANDEEVIKKSEFTALEEALARARGVYDKRFMRMEILEDGTFKAYYADGTVYESDVIARMLVAASTELDLTSLIENGLTSFTAEEVASEIKPTLVLFAKEWLKEQGVEFPEFKNKVDTNTEDIVNLEHTVDSHRKSAIESKEKLTAQIGQVESKLNEKILELDAIITDMLNGTVIWTNPNPNSEFLAQTIEIDLSEYKRIVVENDENVRVVCYEKDKNYQLWRHTSGGSVGRTVSFSDLGVRIGTYSAGMQSNDNLCIPLKIIAYKY